MGMKGAFNSVSVKSGAQEQNTVHVGHRLYVTDIRFNSQLERMLG
jgi:hypothetical protein